MGLLALSVPHFLLLGALLFGLGMFGVVTRRSAIGILIAIELMFNGVNVTFAALNHYVWPHALTGQVMIVFVIAVAAAEAAIGLALVIAVFRQFRTSMADEVALLNDSALATVLAPFRKLGAPDVDGLPADGGAGKHHGH